MACSSRSESATLRSMLGQHPGVAKFTSQAISIVRGGAEGEGEAP